MNPPPEQHPDPDLAIMRPIFERFPIKTVVDIGANYGRTVKMWLDLGATTVMAIEPVPKIFEYLHSRYLHDRRVVCFCSGIGAMDERVDDLALYNCYSLRPVADPRLERSLELRDDPPFSVRFSPLDAFEFRPDFVKIDVDGMEAKVLAGAAKTLAHRPPVLFELSYLPQVYGDSCERMVNQIFDLGYQIETFGSMAGQTFTTWRELDKVFPWHSSYDVLLTPAP